VTPMGRPPRENPMKKIPVSIERKDWEDIKRIAKKADVPLGKFKRNLLLMGLDDARGMERVGIIGIVGFTRKSIDTIKKTFSEKTLTLFETGAEVETGK